MTRILIVEDDVASARLFKFHMKDYGDIVVADTAQRGVDRFRIAHEHHNPFDLVFLDLYLPDATGLDVLIEIRGLEKDWGLEMTTVAMLTSEDDMEAIELAFEYHCQQYMTKPMNHDRLVPIMRAMGFEESASVA